MRKVILGAAMAVFLTGSVAFGAEINATITHIDVNARIIVVDGRAFHVGTEINIGAFKIGQQVTVVYEVVDGQLKVVVNQDQLRSVRACRIREGRAGEGSGQGLSPESVSGSGCNPLPVHAHFMLSVRASGKSRRRWIPASQYRAAGAGTKPRLPGGFAGGDGLRPPARRQHWRSP